MNDARNFISKVMFAIKVAKNITIWYKLMLIIPFIIIGLVLIFGAFVVEGYFEPLQCENKNCDNSKDADGYERRPDSKRDDGSKKDSSAKETSYLKSSNKKQVLQQKNTVILAISQNKNKVKLVAGMPYQEPTNSPISDSELDVLAGKMIKERQALIDVEKIDFEVDPQMYSQISWSILGNGGSGDSGAGTTIDMSNIKEGDYWAYANVAAQQTGWSALFIYSQWQIESAHFTSPNFRNNNNLAGQTWHPGSKYPKGTARPKSEGGYYIKYPSPVEGYVDFVNSNQRYKHVKEKKTPEEQAKEIAAQGWAANPNYYRDLVIMIKQNRKKYGDSAATPPPVTNEETDSETGEQPEGNTDGDKVVQEAYNMLKTQGQGSSNPIKYSMPKRGQPGYGDCSWFTSKVYKEALGVDIGFTTIEQINKNADYFNTDRNQLKPGDLVYFNLPGGHGHTRTIKGKSITVDHTGIYVGNNKFIDLSSSVGTIAEKDISKGGKYESYFNKAFIGFIRLGEPGTGEYVDFSGGADETHEEADIHLRAMKQSDMTAMLGLDLFERDSHDKIVMENGKRKLKKEFEGTMVEKTYLIAMKLKEDPEKLLWNYATEKRTDNWDDRDWIMNTRFLAYNCYLIGDEPLYTEEQERGSKGLFFLFNLKEWIANLFSGKGYKGPCETLNKTLKEALEEKKKDEEKAKKEEKDSSDKATKDKEEKDKKEEDKEATDTSDEYIPLEDQGVLTQYYKKEEYSYECKPAPKKDETKSSDKTEGKAKQVKGVVGKVQLVREVTEKNIVVGKEANPCEYGIAKTNVETTYYPVFPSLYTGAQDESVLKFFEKYSLMLPNITGNADESYVSEIQRILGDFYADDLSDTSLLETVGGGMEPYIVPMIDGTYNFSSPFRSEHRPSHDGDDMGTSKVAGVPVFSTADGVVESTGFVNGYGNTVMVRHQNGYYSFYAHMRKDDIVVQNGQKVVQGQLLGAAHGMGDKEEGSPSLALHLHFEMCMRAVEAASGNKMCADHVDPEDDDNSKDKLEDDVKLTFNKDQDMSKTNEYANKFLKEWKEAAKNGKVIIMPGLSQISGVLAEEYESKTGECVNSSQDYGGLSCGYYQFSNKFGRICELIQWMGKNGFDEYFNYLSKYCPSGATKVSDEGGFLSNWNKQMPFRQDPNFKKAQFLYQKSAAYDPVAKKVYSQFGLDIGKRHKATQEMFWSIIVQHQNQALTIMKDAGFSKSTNWESVTDKDLITKMYDTRISGTPRYFSKSPNLVPSLQKRFKSEKQKALQLLGNAE
ncbi:hypothetical protein CN918_27580 [Priestia megaterium]|nr:hypothetical protein CN918_27580 [Priestia megaterium]